jgi:hypothetical protein
MPTCWHRGYLNFCGANFCGDGSRQRTDSVENLLWIESAFASKLLPMLCLESCAFVIVADFMNQIFGDVLPNFAANHIVCRCERDAAAADHDRIILGVSICASS